MRYHFWAWEIQSLEHGHAESIIFSIDVGSVCRRDLEHHHSVCSWFVRGARKTAANALISHTKSDLCQMGRGIACDGPFPTSRELRFWCTSVGFG